MYMGYEKHEKGGSREVESFGVQQSHSISLFLTQWQYACNNQVPIFFFQTVYIYFFGWL